MSKKKSDFRVIQVIFKTEKEYKEFHADAVKFHGTDNRLADTAYVRECIETNKKFPRTSTKKKAQALVEGQTSLAEHIRKTKNEEEKTSMKKISQEMIRLWVL